jgi:hypothetical protein
MLSVSVQHRDLAAEIDARKPAKVGRKASLFIPQRNRKERGYLVAMHVLQLPRRFLVFRCLNQIESGIEFPVGSYLLSAGRGDKVWNVVALSDCVDARICALIFMPLDNPKTIVLQALT